MSERSIIALIRKAIPLLASSSRYKGQNGRIGVVGGSRDYTGAPFYAGMAALRTGADLVHIFCHTDASIPIKSYSGELIVASGIENGIDREFCDLHKNLHCLVIGCGLGRSTWAKEAVTNCITSFKNIPIVLDADGLHWALENMDVISEHSKRIILTPNEIELRRLANKLEINETDLKHTAEQVSLRLNGVTILAKGKIDCITNGTKSIINDEPASLKRCGGQGDLLGGATAVFAYWMFKNSSELDVPIDERLLHAAYGSSLITRRASMLAFKQFGRSLIASDILSFIYDGFVYYFGNE